ncbi:MAG: carboxynorspermidine decarboxylase [Gammaproteobacteria bacterium]|uniref:Carboxynorspermidine/carboxyspermidine decarboxylase n=1 Tax=Marinomonas polaris DSM 16579 TaxID=1122206 RepID=A0A1M4SIZ5_9GAMM|nr:MULTISPECIES: carboxynorspermidine decarboxylase [Marinomonas]MBU1467905.1 carboxynorspermidine decarboxylase [Gammaproteobacteria bacterium]MBU2238742.1 carboxynorspermidine decarboxylase [Gammaproteobacteria bacterium]MBU2412819.1 carboxynorspermidine decarboxylase [Gammaproteobacteria bacterium]PJE53634.1 carboxynorspermidine decarboxylase [Marinomonas sp. BSi20584]SHE32213.1 carboxynorspermidine decarboxylase [Marinomonas polaris DSM 16579]
MIKTPYYLIDKAALLKNLEKIAYVRQQSGAKSLLALKCFATWSVFDLMQDYMDGTTSSSLYEVKLGKTKFQGETHAYSVAYSDDEIAEVLDHSDKIIFNSIGQFNRFKEASKDKTRGLRVNPQVSTSEFLIADPARPFSRLGEWDPEKIATVINYISGFMFHNNCENNSFERFDEMLNLIEERFGHLIQQVKWVSLGGGIHFTGEGYPIDKFCQRLKDFAQKYDIQVYLEPGEASITKSTTLEVTVLDTLFNGKNLAVVDSSIEAHMLDLLIYRENAKMAPCDGEHEYMICGKSCLAGDIFGEFKFDKALQVGDRLSFQDAAGYTMVKKNWFNGVKMPSIAIRQLDGSIELVREFGYNDFEQNLS